MRSNPRMREILRTTDVTGLSDRDIPRMFSSGRIPLPMARQV